MVNVFKCKESFQINSKQKHIDPWKTQVWIVQVRLYVEPTVPHRLWLVECKDAEPSLQRVHSKLFSDVWLLRGSGPQPLHCSGVNCVIILNKEQVAR